MARCFGYQPPESFLKLVEEMRSHGKKDIEKWIERKRRREAKEAEEAERKSKRVKYSEKFKDEDDEGERSDVTEELGLPESPCSSSDSVNTRKFTRIDSTKTKNVKMSRHELYEALTTGWTPPPLEKSVSEPEDLSWLFGARKTDVSRGQKRSSEVQYGHGSCAAGHRDQRSNNVLVYALPYTVPY